MSTSFGRRANERADRRFRPLNDVSASVSRSRDGGSRRSEPRAARNAPSEAETPTARLPARLPVSSVEEPAPRVKRGARRSRFDAIRVTQQHQPDAPKTEPEAPKREAACPGPETPAGDEDVLQLAVEQLEQADAREAEAAKREQAAMRRARQQTDLADQLREQLAQKDAYCQELEAKLESLVSPPAVALDAAGQPSHAASDVRSIRSSLQDHSVRPAQVRADQPSAAEPQAAEPQLAEPAPIRAASGQAQPALPKEQLARLEQQLRSERQANAEVPTGQAPAIAQRPTPAAVARAPAEAPDMTGEAIYAEDLRKAKRVDANKLTTLWAEGMTTPLSCTMLDRSSTGAKLEILSDRFNNQVNDISVGDEFTLTVNYGNERASIKCEVIWLFRQRCGVRYCGQIVTEAASPMKKTHSDAAPGADVFGKRGKAAFGNA